MRMFGPKGNPRANNLFAVIGKLQRVSGVLPRHFSTFQRVNSLDWVPAGPIAAKA
jgi:hypothetical protein